MVKVRGIYKGIKCISQIFVYKKHEMEIGYPTDVKHVAHIGWDNASSNAPSWMNEFKTTTGSWNKNSKPTEPSWNSQVADLGQQRRSQTSPDVTKQPPAIPKVPKKTRRRRQKNSSSSVESSTSLESYATALEGQESLELTDN